MLGNVTFGDMVSGRGEKDATELGLTGTTGGGWLQLGKSLLSFSGERDPVRFTEVIKCASGRVWGV